MDKELEVKVPGGKIVVSVTESQGEYKQISAVFYESATGNPFDIVLLELKDGESAALAGYPESGNTVLDAYVYEDTYSEDYTHHHKIHLEDFVEISKEV